MLTSKTKLGAVLLALGVAVYNTVDLCPAASWVPWIKYFGAIISAAGGALGLVGIGNKVDRATAAVSSPPANLVSPEIKEGPAPLTEARFLELLARARAKKGAP